MFKLSSIVCSGLKDDTVKLLASESFSIMKSLLDLKLPCENIRIFLCHGATSVNHQFICVILVHEMA